MASFKISGSISTLPLSLILGIISIQIIFQLSSDQQQSLDIESETISAYFNRNDQPSLKTSSSKALATYNLSTMSHTATMNRGAIGGYHDFDDRIRINLLEQEINVMKQTIDDLRGPPGITVPKARNDGRGDVQDMVRIPSDGQKSDDTHDTLTSDDGGHYFPVRVSVARREKGELIQPGPSEIFMIPSDCKTSNSKSATRDNLIHKIRKQFNQLVCRDPISHPNIPQSCVWNDAYEVESIRINWDPKNLVEYEGTFGTGVGRNETEVTDFNAKACLTCLEKCSINEYSLNVLIGLKGQVKKNWAKDRNAEDARLWDGESGVAQMSATPDK